VAYYFTDALVLGPMLGDGTMSAARSTNYIPENMFLPMLKQFEPSTASVGIYIAIVLAFIVAFLLYKTNKGYEIRIVGNNPKMAEYGGISVNRTILYIMLVSGFIAGIAGAIEILGVHHRFPLRFSSQLGFDGVVVSLLANNNPIGITVSAFFFGTLKTGFINMQRISDVPAAMTDVVRGIIILIVSANFAFNLLKKRVLKKKRQDNHQNAGDAGQFEPQEEQKGYHNGSTVN
jgi:simple sugar transport system permease protein